MDRSIEYLVFYPAPLIAILSAWGMWRAEVRNPGIGRWRAVAAGLSVGLFGWPAVSGMVLAIGSILISLAGNALWILLALITWTPGRG